MANDENIIEDLDTLLGQPINEQPVGIPQEQYDLYNANIDATISGDRSRMSVINQLIKAEEQGLAGSKAWNRAAADHQLPEGTVPEQPDLLKGAVPGWVSGMTVDNLGIMNRMLDIDYMFGRGDDPDRGFYDYFANTFKGAISGEHDKGEMFISYEELEARPDLLEYLDNAAEGMEQNAIRLMNEFMEDKKFRTEDEFQDWRLDMFTRDVTGELTDEEQKDFDYIKKLQFQREHKEAAVESPDGKGIIISSFTLPDIEGEPDPKFVNNRLQLPYFGTLERNEQGELNMPAASAFRFTDNPLYGLSNIAETRAPEVTKSMEDYFYPKISPWWDYGENPEQQMGYQVGQIASGLGVVKAIGKPLVKHGYKGGKGLYNLLRRKLLGYKPVDTSSWKLTP